VIYKERFPNTGRHFSIAIPDDYDRQSALPLIFTLHYGGPVSPYYGYELLANLVEPALHQLGAIIVAPDCNHGHWANSQSESEILELYDFIQETYRIDKQKTLLTGYSLGGVGTWYIAGRHQERFAAALPMAAHPPADVSEFSWDIPLYLIHGREDQLFPLEPLESFVEQLAASGNPIQLVVLEGVTHYETFLYTEPLAEAIPWIRRTWSA
jgi:predicted peptidase